MLTQQLPRLAPEVRVQRLVAMVTSAESAKHLELANGVSMPIVGLGLWKIDKRVCADTCYEAIKAGYRCFDGACDYGNEKECGEGIRRAIDEGLVARKDIFVTSKLWNTYHRPEHVGAACQKSLDDLGLDYIDLYMIHFPISQKFVPFETRYPPEWFYDPSSSSPRIELDPVPMHLTWAAMEELVGKGKAKNIGVCNIGTTMIRDMLSYAKIKPAVLQVELHPYNAQPKLVRFCQLHGIAVTGFSNLGAGSYVELGGATQDESCLVDPVVQAIARKHGKTPAQIVLRWAVQRGTGIVPKSVKPARLRENIDVFGFVLTSDEMSTLDNLDRGKRFNDPGVFCEGAFNTFVPIYE